MTTQEIIAARRVSLARFFDVGRYHEVIEQARLETIVSPGDDFFWKAWGSASWFLGDSSTSIKALTRSLRVNPVDQDACVNLGVALQSVGSGAAAVDTYYRALILGIDVLSPYYNFAITLLELGDVGASLRRFLRCVQLDPCNPQVWGSLANVYKIQGLTDSAINAYQKAICTLPSAVKPLSDLGVIVSTIDPDLSSHLHNWALRLATDDSIYLCNYAFALTQMGVLTEAVAVLQRAVSVKPDCHSSWMGLAVATRDLRRSSEALHMISRSLAIRPSSAPSIDCRGGILSRMGAVSDGIESHKMAVSLCPNFLKA